MDTLIFAYYCSGHGYGHATRVSAFTRHLLSLGRHLTVHIISSAPRHVFADSIACGALYRYADIDPVIVQPLAYRVDRQKSVEGLEEFLRKKDAMLERECAWLIESGVNCVLSDAAFLGCLAAKSAGIPSILVTNFTFDSVYSYLATSLVDNPPAPGDSQLELPDIPIPQSILEPLVAQIHEGYRHADLLLRLPGHIPIPSFLTYPPLPSPEWVDPVLNKLHDDVAQHLLSPLDAASLLTPRPFPNSYTIPRATRTAPLLVRPPSPEIYTPQGRAEFLERISLPNFEGMKILVVSFGGQVFKRPGGSSRTTSRIQSRNLSQEVLPLPTQTQVVSSGTNATNDDHLEFKKPRRKRSSTALKPLNTNTGTTKGGQTAYLDLEALDNSLRTHVKYNTVDYIPACHRSLSARLPNSRSHFYHHLDENTSDFISSDVDNGTSSSQDSEPESTSHHHTITTTTYTNGTQHKRRHTLPSRRHYTPGAGGAYDKLATPSHLLIPGAPPVSKPPNILSRAPSLGRAAHNSQPSSGMVETPETRVIPPTPVVTHDSTDQYFEFGDTVETSHNLSLPADDTDASGVLLPDENWIAVICGVSKEQWNAENEEGGLPEGFYVAPRDVYMPDLVAVGDVVLGKLGYGMTSECVDACTPFVYVSRPLFIEEHGLRIYLDEEGVGVELSRAAYEGGEWAHALEEAYHKGRERKEEKKRKEFEFYLKLKQMDVEGVGRTDEMRLSERERQGREMAHDVVEWVRGIWDDVLGCGGSRHELRMCMRDPDAGRHLPEDGGAEMKEIMVA